MSARPTRRQWLAGGAALGASLAVGGCGRTVRAAAPARRGLVLGPGSTRPAPDAPSRYHLAIADLDAETSEPRYVVLDFMAHGIVPDPSDPARFVLLEKRGRGACEIDLVSAAVVRPIETRAERQFYGHGAFSPDGGLLYATETVMDDDYRGVVVVRDGRTLEELGTIESHGSAPHDLHLCDGGRVLAITNGGGEQAGGAAPSLAFVETDGGRLLEKLEIEESAWNAGHVALSPDGEIALVSAARPWLGRDALGGVSLGRRGRSLRAMRAPEKLMARLFGEALSVAIHAPTRRAWISHPGAHVVTVWDLVSARLVATHELAWPRGVTCTLDGGEIQISHGADGRLVAFDPHELGPIGSASRVFGSNGSHLLVHDAGRSNA